MDDNKQMAAERTSRLSEDEIHLWVAYSFGKGADWIWLKDRYD